MSLVAGIWLGYKQTDRAERSTANDEWCDDGLKGTQHGDEKKFFFVYFAYFYNATLLLGSG